ncbi:hypothetical protein Tco_1062007 [Tanacetum coccineum]
MDELLSRKAMLILQWYILRVYRLWPGMKSGDGRATGCIGSPSYPNTMTRGMPPSDYTPHLIPEDSAMASVPVFVIQKCR